MDWFLYDNALRHERVKQNEGKTQCPWCKDSDHMRVIINTQSSIDALPNKTTLDIIE